MADISVVALLFLSIAATIAVVRSFGWELSSVVVLAVLLLSRTFLLRPLMFVVGLDSPFPDVYFIGRDVEGAMVKTQLAYLLWLALFTVVAKATSRVPFPAALSRPLLPSDASINRLAPLLCGLAVVTSAVVWYRYGISDLGGVAKARQIDLPRILRTPAVLLAYLGVPLAVVGARRRSGAVTALGVVAFILGAGVSFTWGSRDAAILPLLIVPIAVFERARINGQLTARRVLRAVPWLAAGTVVVLSLGVGLRVARELLAYGETLDRTTEGSLARQVAVTTNNTSYDTLLLVFDDQEPSPERAGLGIFVDAFETTVIGGGADGTFMVPAVTIAQTYEPSRPNGWPVTAVGDWYFAAGFVGVAIGAVVSGFVFQLIDNWRRRQPSTHWVAVTAITVFWITTVAGSGIGVTAITRARSLMGVALLILVGWVVAERTATKLLRSTPAIDEADLDGVEPTADV